jgi:hypothetical protein
MTAPANPSSAPFPLAAGPSVASGGTTIDPQAEAALGGLGALAQELQGQPEALLALLRRLEQLHREIQDGPFRASLPEDRNRLFDLLAEMERSGGWPYIPRLQLRTFLDLLQRDEKDDDSVAA